MTRRPMLFLLHGLGCSATTWDLLVDELDGTVDCVALDLPGHGDASRSDALTVEQMSDRVLAELVERRPETWALVGHSMGGKIAALVTARAERGVPGLSRPRGLVLVAASPVSPEPMDGATRADMISWCVGDRISLQHAEQFVDANTANPLPPDRRLPAVADVRRVSRAAWLAWLERGSREDWSAAFDAVHTPTLVVSGAEDGDLGGDAQRALVLPRVAASEVVEIADAAHLIMLEQPAALAAVIIDHVRSVTASRDALPTAMRTVVDSDRVSARTRAVMLDRVAEPSSGAGALDNAQLTLLTALLARVVPQRDTTIDLAGRIDVALAAGVSDGWRFADLPRDADAWRNGLDTLAAVCGDFVGADPAGQDAWIEAMVAGHVGSDDPEHLSADLMVLWFEDVRAEAVRTWLSHPAAMARIGYDGFANGGDGLRKQGYLTITTGEHERWQLALPAQPVVRSVPSDSAEGGI